MSYIRDGKSAGENFIEIIETHQANLNSDINRVNKIQQIGKDIDRVTSLIYEFTNLESSEYDTDDEIINWTFPDVIDDLISATWNLHSGLYKTSASNLRNAFEMSFLSLYFQLRQNSDFKKGIDGYNKFFKEWDNGTRPTPNWGEMKTIVNQNENIIKYNLSRSCNVIDEVYSWYSYLRNFTHGKPFDNSINNVTSKPTNHMNIGVGFTIANFERFSGYISETISWISIFWTLSFPEILQSTSSIDHYQPLFKNTRGVDVFDYITKDINA